MLIRNCEDTNEELGMILDLVLHDSTPTDSLSGSLRALEITGVQYDSRNVTAGDAFFCIRGLKADGHDFAGQAAKNGASVLVVEHAVEGIDSAVPQIIVADSRIALALSSAAFFGHPSEKISVFGITGTNGKTTTCYLLDAILRSADVKTALVGTVETRIGNVSVEAARTTPESRDLAEMCADMVSDDVEALSMEISSHAIDLSRIAGMHFTAVGFTNLTQEHLDYHHSLEEYYAVKRRLFTDFKTNARIIDIDTPCGLKLAEDVSNLPGVLTVGRSLAAALRVTEEIVAPHSTTFTLTYKDASVQVTLPLAGPYNVSNALVAAGCALSAGYSLEQIAAGLGQAPQAPGRLQRVDAGQPFEVVVDYAHTPDALENALKALRSVTPNRLIVVFGCGGDRDRTKRPIMGEIAGRVADVVYITSDNPRTENPDTIVAEVWTGVRAVTDAYHLVVNRAEAINQAIAQAQPGDCILLAGKGHETYQEINGMKHHFDDREQALSALASCGWEAVDSCE